MLRYLWKDVLYNKHPDLVTSVIFYRNGKTLPRQSDVQNAQPHHRFNDVNFLSSWGGTADSVPIETRVNDNELVRLLSRPNNELAQHYDKAEGGPRLSQQFVR